MTRFVLTVSEVDDDGGSYMQSWSITQEYAQVIRAARGTAPLEVMETAEVRAERAKHDDGLVVIRNEVTLSSPEVPEMDLQADANPVYLSLDAAARGLWDLLLEDLGPDEAAALDDLADEIWAAARDMRDS